MASLPISKKEWLHITSVQEAARCRVTYEELTLIYSRYIPETVTFTTYGQYVEIWGDYPQGGGGMHALFYSEDPRKCVACCQSLVNYFSVPKWACTDS